MDVKFAARVQDGGPLTDILQRIQTETQT